MTPDEQDEFDRGYQVGRRFAVAEGILYGFIFGTIAWGILLMAWNTFK